MEGRDPDEGPCPRLRQVSLEFSDSSAVPGEQLTMQLKAQPDALCGVSAVDRSVYVKEPVRSLTADTVGGTLLSQQIPTEAFSANTNAKLPTVRY